MKFLIAMKLIVLVMWIQIARMHSENSRAIEGIAIIRVQERNNGWPRGNYTWTGKEWRTNSVWQE